MKPGGYASEKFGGLLSPDGKREITEHSQGGKEETDLRREKSKESARVFDN